MGFDLKPSGWTYYLDDNRYFLYICSGVRMTEGNEIRSLLLFPKLMNVEAPIKAIEQKVNQLLENEPGFFLVEVTLKPTNNIKVFVDADQGASIDRLVYLNRALYKQVGETMFPNGDFSLEVSSPGLEEPLKLHRQYLKNIERNVEVLQKDGIKREGKLLSASETEIVLEEETARLTGKNKNMEVGQGKGKRKEIVQYMIPFENIKTTKVQIKF